MEKQRLEFEREKQAQSHELALRQAEMSDRTSPLSAQLSNASPNPSPSAMSFPLDAFNDKVETADQYLDRFERIAKEYELDESKWTVKLAQGLRGQAYEVYTKLPSQQLGNYAALKQAILTRYELTADAYRKKFRQAQKSRGETYTQFADRLHTYLQKWIALAKVEETYEGLSQHFLMEQVRETMSCELRTFTAEHGATTLSELTELADRYITAHEQDRPRKSPSQKSLEKGDANHTFRYADQSQRTKFKPAGTGRTPPSLRPQPAETARRGPYCSFCKTTSHFTVDCRRKKPHSAPTHTAANMHHVDSDHTPSLTPQERLPPLAPPVSETVQVNGIHASCLYDTGLSYDAIVRRSLVQTQDISDETITIQGPDRSIPASSLPVATIQIESRYVTGSIKAAVMDHPIYDVILGCRYVFLGTPPSSEAVAAVQTRSQTKQEARPEVPSNPLPIEIKEEQLADPSLANCYKKLPKARTPPSTGDFFEKKGLLFRQTEKGHPQLVVPTQRRPQILELGHTIPFSGHMGIGATTQRITAHYYWPGITTDIKRFVQSCPQCQKLSRRHYTVPATLGEMPVTGTPFQRVAVDIIGPLTLTKKRNRFVLTLVDPCTMWSEAVPLSTIDTKKVADALITIFTRVGFPAQILSDNGSQFTGKLMQEVFALLQSNHVRTSPYHPQSNGQVERFNGTLISMLRKLAEEKPENWDTYIPAALFAYREIPHASTGLSPALMLFGRPIAGPLEALKRSWTDCQVDESVRTATQYVAELKDKLQTTWKLAADQLKRARVRQAKYYNRHAKDRELQVGDQALLLLPKGNHKLELSWQGPFPVTGKLSRTNYKIEIKGKPKVYHINLLKRFQPRNEPAPAEHLMALALAEEVEQNSAAVECPLEPQEAYEDALVNPVLTRAHLEQIWSILKGYAEVLTDKPGRTHLEEVTLTLTDPSPIRQRPYPVPLAKQAAIQKEIEYLHKEGIISPSKSPYNAGVVLLRKPNGEHRLCIDYRRLNAVTEFQVEPLPDPNQLFAKLHGAKYFTRIDLSKGYYQIPVPKHLRPYLAFSANEAHWEFNVLPFGLNNAPSIFTRMMRKLLEPIHQPGMYNFMDDILLATPTWEEHKRLLTTLLQRLREVGLTARPSKCKIGFQEMEFLGHTLREGCISPEEKNVEKMRNAPRPITKKNVRSFLGMCGFYQKFIPHFNSLSAPLSDLTKKKVPEKVTWTAECERIFQLLKEKISSQPILQLPNGKLPFVLRTDASNEGLGAALLQSDLDNRDLLKPVAYASRKLNAAERNYSTIEKECLALVWAIQKYQLYLYGKHFTVQCDHKPLTFLASTQPQNARLMRWSLLLQPYSFRVEYIPGDTNHLADFLSRHPVGDETQTMRPIEHSHPF